MTLAEQLDLQAKYADALIDQAKAESDLRAAQSRLQAASNKALAARRELAIALDLRTEIPERLR